MRGGLLGAGHSWVAMPSSAPDGGDAVARSNAPLQRPEEVPLSLLDRACARMYNAFEDVCDALVDRATMSQSSLATCIAAAAAVGLALTVHRSSRS